MIKIIDPTTNIAIDEQREPIIGDYVEEVKGKNIVRYWYSYSAVDNGELIAIAIDAVTNTIADFDDKDNQHTVNENSNSVASGSGLTALYAMGLKKFRVPFVRTDTNRKAYMIADITADGSFSITINFKTGGEWVVNSELLNSELSDEELALFKFSIAEHKFKVV